MALGSKPQARRRFISIGGLARCTRDGIGYRRSSPLSIFSIVNCSENADRFDNGCVLRCHRAIRTQAGGDRANLAVELYRPDGVVGAKPVTPAEWVSSAVVARN